MDSSCLRILFGTATGLFALSVLRIAPTSLRLLRALLGGTVEWPGPRIHDPAPSASTVRQNLGIRYEHLYSTYAFYALGLVGAFIFSLSIFLSSLPWFRDYVWIDTSWMFYVITLVGLVGGLTSIGKVMRNLARVQITLSDRASGLEPRSVDGHSAAAEYAIEHPLIGSRHLGPEGKRALDLYYESVRCVQDGKDLRALTLYQEATRIEPSLHEKARELLAETAKESGPEDQGAAYYWMGIHSEWLADRKQAAASYQKAIEIYKELGYRNRESRAHCNLGNVKMNMRVASAMDEFEEAIALNPRNGTAHLNIASTYYRISNPGDPRFERALDAFADAIVADPMTNGPRVASSMRDISYTWKEDLEEVTRRFEAKMDKLSGEQYAG